MFEWEECDWEWDWEWEWEWPLGCDVDEETQLEWDCELEPELWPKVLTPLHPIIVPPPDMTGPCVELSEVTMVDSWVGYLVTVVVVTVTV